LAGVDHCEALAAATNNNLVGVPPGRTRMAEWPAAAGEAEREKTTHRGAWLLWLHRPRIRASAARAVRDSGLHRQT
jgi:hypothetical protein